MNPDMAINCLKQKEWFQEKIKYFGDGIAEFENPNGRIFGKTKITVDKNGELQIQMDVDKYESNENLPFGVQQLISRETPKIENDEISITLPPKEENQCIFLQVKTEFGIFQTKQVDLITNSFSIKNGKEKNRILFYPSQSEFIISNEEPYYWVLPLFNYVGNFDNYEKEIKDHPLRMFSELEIPNDISEKEKEINRTIIHQKCKIIKFTFKNEIGFIEGLPNYYERVNELISYKKPLLITAVMVSRTCNHACNIEEIDNWFPYYFLDLLSFVTGTEVTSPWIEIRDKQGNLIKRIHNIFPRTLFLRGKRVFNEAIHSGISNLLTKAQVRSEAKENFLLTASRYSMLAGREGQTIEDKITYLCRGLDLICEHYKFAGQDLLSPFDTKMREEIIDIIQNAKISVRKIQARGEIGSESIEFQYLEKIKNRIINAPYKENDFGLAVCNLLDFFGLPDGQLLNKYFENNPTDRNVKSWACLLSKYRGAAIHTGHLGFLNSGNYLKESLVIINHLHDLMVRIILIITGYDGKYQPSMFSYSCPSEINWVKPDTLPYYLGYQGSIRFTMMKITKKLHK
jgi:hypothetical protein